MRTVPRYIYVERMRDKIGLNGKHYGMMHNLSLGLLSSCVLYRLNMSEDKSPITRTLKRTL